MKNQFQLSMLISFTVLLASLLLASATVSAAQQGSGSNSAEQGRERLEMEMEKHTGQDSPPGDASKTREQMRTTEEMQKEADKTEPARETSRKWWEFWK